MKKLLICRHGKSSWEDPYLSDHARPLSLRGLRNSKDMATRLLSHSIQADKIFTSDAKRARDTAFITAEVLGLNKDIIEQQENLFHASAATILETVKSLPATISTTFIFGHNPGLNELIWMLGGDIDNLPTAGQYGFSFDIADWSKMNHAEAIFWYYDYPKSIKKNQNLRTS